jgi:hypothetical protein
LTVENEENIVNILISYLICEKPPINKKYFKNINLLEMSDAISYMDRNLVDYIIFVRYWTGYQSIKFPPINITINKYFNQITSLKIEDSIKFKRHI